MKTKLFAAASGFVLLLLIFFVAGCQQEDQVTPGSKLINRAPPDNCLPSNPAWTDNAPCAGEDLTVELCFSADCGQAQMQQFIGGVWVQVAHENPLVGGCISVTIPNAAAGTYNFRGAYVSSGGSCNFCNVGFNDNLFSVTVVECSDCEDSFTSACTTLAGCAHAITYTFIPAVSGHYKIQGGINGAPGTSYCSGSASTGLTGGLNGNGAFGTTWEGDLTACQTYTVTIGWNGTNGSTGDWSSKSNDGVAHGGDRADGYLTGKTCN